MKNATKLVGIIVVAIMAIAIISCKHDEPTPVPQSKTISEIPTTGGQTANVTVNYTALPSVVPSYMPLLEEVVKEIFNNNTKPGNFTINVIAIGNDSFTISSGALSVRESWIANATKDQVGSGIMSKINEWTK
jgi:hypothetical protein